MALGVIAASDWASWPAPDGSRTWLSPSAVGGRLEGRAHPLVGRGRLRPSEPLDLDPEPERRRLRARPLDQRLLERVLLGAVERAALQPQARVPGTTL